MPREFVNQNKDNLIYFDPYYLGNGFTATADDDHDEAINS